jgi:hypothetical protein
MIIYTNYLTFLDNCCFRYATIHHLARARVQVFAYFYSVLTVLSSGRNKPEFFTKDKQKCVKLIIMTSNSYARTYEQFTEQKRHRIMMIVVIMIIYALKLSNNVIKLFNKGTSYGKCPHSNAFHLPFLNFKCQQCLRVLWVRRRRRRRSAQYCVNWEATKNKLHPLKSCHKYFNFLKFCTQD